MHFVLKKLCGKAASKVLRRIYRQGI